MMSYCVSGKDFKHLLVACFMINAVSITYCKLLSLSLLKMMDYYPIFEKSKERSTLLNPAGCIAIRIRNSAG